MKENLGGKNEYRKIMKNDFFSIEVSADNGGITSLIFNDDQNKMNWVEGNETWGVPRDSEVISVETLQNEVVAVYKKKNLQITVKRTLLQDRLEEVYRFTNTGSYDLYFQRGALSIPVTFNDSYDSSVVCESNRCHTHLWCARENSYVHALKMGPFDRELALILTSGSLDNYSVRRLIEEWSNDRGDFLLHPMPFHLLPHASAEISWEVLTFPKGQLRQTLLKSPNFSVVSFEQETIFLGESFRITAECQVPIREGKVLCKGREVPCKISGNKLVFEYKPDSFGEFSFEIEVNGRTTNAAGFCTLPLEDLAERRIRFIVKNQQMTDSASPLYGAYLVYDNEEKSQYFDFDNTDHNACRERFGMAMLICRWLQTHEDEAVEKSLNLFEAFLMRECFDEESGAVYNNIGKDASRIRLYNAPWVIRFWCEMYILRKEEKYLRFLKTTIADYYKKGGAKFYPNGCLFSDAVVLLKEAGFTDDAREAQAYIKTHVENIVKNGILYPPHEVRFEQTIVTPALAILCAYYKNIEKDSKVFEEIKKHVEILERFDGHQPDHRLCEIPIRHWDGYWFGKRKVYGDTFPHYWSCLSGQAYLLFAEISGEKEYVNKAIHCLRNCLCSFFEDGSASCAYLYPYSVTMINRQGTEITPRTRGEFFDPWANDQDWALYFMLECQAYISADFLSGREKILRSLSREPPTF